MKKIIVSPADYVGNKVRELANGRLTFSKAEMKYFCNTYTFLNFDDLNSVDLVLLKGRMINIYSSIKFWEPDSEWDGIKLEFTL